MTERKISDAQIEKAVDNLIDSWDIDVLIDFAYEERLHYFLHHADKEEVRELVEDYQINPIVLHGEDMRFKVKP